MAWGPDVAEKSGVFLVRDLDLRCQRASIKGISQEWPRAFGAEIVAIYVSKCMYFIRKAGF